MKGFTLFVTDLDRCKGKKEELKRISKELVKIRDKFKSNYLLNGYQKKKYICKLVLIYLLGYKFDFGLIEAIKLLSSNIYSEKQAGYLFVSVVTGEDYNFMSLVINVLKKDLLSSNHVFQNLALQFIANNTSVKLADALADLVADVLLYNDTTDFVKQSAVLTLLQLLQIKPDFVLDELKVTYIINLISCEDLGLVTASASLIEFLTKNFTSQYESCVQHCIDRLSKIVFCSSADFLDYTYYDVAAPWTTVKLLQILQNVPPILDTTQRTYLRQILKVILKKAEDIPDPKRFEHKNVKFAIIFEAISLITQMNFKGLLLSQAFNILGVTLQRKELNFKCMALEMMTQLTNNTVYLEHVKSQWSAILNLLKSEQDITIEKQVIDLLYAICSECSVKPIVDQMLYLLECEHHYSEEILLRATALTEQFGTDRKWYFDTILKLLQTYGDKMTDTVWHSLVNIVIDDDKIQEYAAKASYAILSEENSHNKAIKMGSYILGEFGRLIARDPQNNYKMQFNALKDKYRFCSSSTKALFLTTFVKFLNIYPDLKDEIRFILKNNIQNENVEIQQRAVEYLKLSEIASRKLLTIVLEEMPSKIKKAPGTTAAIEVEKSEKIGLQSILNHPRRNSLTLFHLHHDNKMALENYNEIKPINGVQKVSSTTATGAKKSQKLGLVRIINLPRRKELALSRSYWNLKSVFENSAEVNVHMTKSESQSNFRQASSCSNLSLLMEVFKDTPIFGTVTEKLPKTSEFSSQISGIPNNQSFLHNLLFNEKAKLYENDAIAIIVESTFIKNFGKFHLKYMNKTNDDFYEFSIKENFSNIENKCSIQLKPRDSILLAKEIIEEDILLECLSEFAQRPSMILKFVSEKQHNEIKLILPLTLNKFVEPCNMSPEAFIKRWQDFECIDQEITKEFSAKYPMIYAVTRQKLKGFRLSVIENMNLEPENFYCAGIFYTHKTQVGFLVRLERYPLSKKYRSIVRSRELSLSLIVSDLLLELL